MFTTRALKRGVATALGVAALAAANLASAATIDWLNFDTWTPDGDLGPQSFTDGAGLTADAEFTAQTTTSWPRGASLTLADPTWPFANNVIPAVVTFSDPLPPPGSGTLNTVLTIDFTSMGGLPAGGSVGIIDLEGASSTVMLTGYQLGNPVAVNWTVTPYQPAGIVSPDPTWNPVTSTLQGTFADMDDAPSELNNFIFLISDLQLDSLVLTISTVEKDGVGYAVSKQTVPAVPEPVTLLLLGSGLAGLALSRRAAARRS